jgi:hypothetical protein
MLFAAAWAGVGVAKMAALVWLIDQDWQRALLALLLAWTLAGAGLALRRRPAA